DEQRAHPVIAEAFPHLGEEECGEAARVPEEAAVVHRERQHTIRKFAMKAVLIGTYEMGRQSFGLASPAAWLKAAGWDVTCADLSRRRRPDERIAPADLIAFPLPMHTATRLAAPVVARVRRLNPASRICAYGLYAPLNEGWLRSIGVDAVFGG